MRRILIITALILAYGGSAYATTVTIDFQGSSVTTVTPNKEYLSYGYRLTGDIPDPLPFPGPWGLQYFPGYTENSMTANGTVLRIAREDGGLFALHQYDALVQDPCYPGFGGCPAPQKVVGTHADGSTVTFLRDVTFSNSPPPAHWITYSLNDPAWSQLVKVEIFPYGSDVVYSGTFDNIVVSSVVPLPAAVYLFVSGLALLLCARRRKLHS